MYLTDFMGFSCIEQDTLGSSSLTSIDVSHDADVACQMQILLCHCLYMCILEIFLPNAIRSGSERRHG